MMEAFSSLPAPLRVLVIAVLAIAAHFFVRGLRTASQKLLTTGRKGGGTQEAFFKRFPRAATLTTLVVSALTFTIYFLALGMILREFQVSLTSYLASATVIGLAIGFGSQGFVQDVVIGLTLIFSDAMNIGDVVQVSGEIGRVESIGLRFTTLMNLHKQRIYVPNRNIGMISLFRGGCIRAYVDIQLQPDGDQEKILTDIEATARGMFRQHRSLILSEPELFGTHAAGDGGWHYARIKFRVWPGQSAIIETTFRQRVVALMKGISPDYADWMVTVTFRVD